MTIFWYTNVCLLHIVQLALNYEALTEIRSMSAIQVMCATQNMWTMGSCGSRRQVSVSVWCGAKQEPTQCTRKCLSISQLLNKLFARISCLCLLVQWWMQLFTPEVDRSHRDNVPARGGQNMGKAMVVKIVYMHTAECRSILFAHNDAYCGAHHIAIHSFSHAVYFLYFCLHWSEHRIKKKKIYANYIALNQCGDSKKKGMYKHFVWSLKATTQ